MYSSDSVNAMDSHIYVRYLNGPLQWLGIIVGLAVVAAVVPTMIDSTWAAVLFGALVIVATVACIMMRVKIVVSDDDVAVSIPVSYTHLTLPTILLV